MNNFTYMNNVTCITDNVYFLAVPSAGEANIQFSTITAAIAIPLSIVYILFGYMLFQILIGLTTAAISAVAVIYGLRTNDISCDIISWTAPACAIVAFCLGVLIARRAGCIFGVFIGGAIPYMIFTLFPSISVIDTGEATNFKFLGFYLLPVWATVGISALLCGIALFRYINVIKIVSTSAIGAYSAVASTTILIADPPENWIFAVAVSAAFVAGVGAQYTIKSYREHGSCTPLIHIRHTKP